MSWLCRHMPLLVHVPVTSERLRLQRYVFARYGLSVFVWYIRMYAQPGFLLCSVTLMFNLLVNIIYPLINFECDAGT